MAVGKIYCGCCSYKRVNGYFKIGMTMQGVGTRASQIRKTDVGFEILDFVKFPNINKEKLMFIESYVRLVMSKAEGLYYDSESLDHFCFKAKNNADMKQKAKAYAKLVKKAAIDGEKLANKILENPLTN